jgi:hypothetical protein
MTENIENRTRVVEQILNHNQVAKKPKDPQSKLTYYVENALPQPSMGHTISEYDQARDAIISETSGNTIRVEVQGKTPQQIYNGLLPRVLEYNKDPHRIYDLSVNQRIPYIFLSKAPRQQP